MSIIEIHWNYLHETGADVFIYIYIVVMIRLNELVPRCRSIPIPQLLGTACVFLSLSWFQYMGAVGLLTTCCLLLFSVQKHLDELTQGLRWHGGERFREFCTQSPEACNAVGAPWEFRYEHHSEIMSVIPYDIRSCSQIV